ncbi:MAG: MAP7 domain-containing protein [Planctomycetota bacterium]|nr:MAP7 domain-containing protein [Planctomycetota bacterium]
MKPQTDHVLLSFFLVIAFALAGCGEKTSQAPPKQMVQDTVRASLPPFLSLDSIELEPIPTGPEAVKVNFKATVTPKEDLYQVDREVEGTPPVTLLKVVQAAGTEVSLYGSVEASRTMDQWTLESPEIQVGLRQFGAPRGAFPAQSYVTGSKEANEALRQQAANAAEIERARKAAREQEELERIARQEQEERERIARQEQEAREAKARQEREEKERIALEELRRKEMEQRTKEEEERQKEEAAVRQKLILATVPGTRYIGTMVEGDEIQRIVLVFTEQKDFLIRAEANNPDKPKSKQTFTGTLVFNPQPEEGTKYHIVMSPISAGSAEDYTYFYTSKEGSLKLCLTDTGLEGYAQMSYHRYTIRLKREGTPLATPPAADTRRGPDGIVRPLVPPPLPQPLESPQAPQPEAPRSP